MKELYELREKLCDELKSYGKKDMSTGSLDVVDKLAHAVKNIDKIIDAGEGYSGMTRDSRGRYSRERYSRDGYSYHDDMIGELRHLMNEAPNEETRHEFKRFINKMESM